MDKPLIPFIGQSYRYGADSVWEVIGVHKDCNEAKRSSYAGSGDCVRLRTQDSSRGSRSGIHYWQGWFTTRYWQPVDEFAYWALETKRNAEETKMRRLQKTEGATDRL